MRARDFRGRENKVTETRTRARNVTTRKKPIGVFDSGIGGLTVFKEIRRILPGESILYVADTAHVPYGEKSPEQIKSFALSLCRYLERRGVKMIVMGCNFSSSVALQDAKAACHVPVLGLIEYAARTAAQKTKNNRVGILATAGTVKTKAYQRAIVRASPRVRAVAKGCPEFVPLIERGVLNGNETRRAAKKYLAPVLKHRADTVILGCTHYPLVKKVLYDITGSDICFVDPAACIAKKVKAVLKGNALLHPDESAKPRDEFIATGSGASLKNYGSLFLGNPISRVKKITLR